MAINEQIVTGRKFRKLIDITNKTWQRMSFWTHSSDVEFTDGKTAETKVGAIDGITDSLASNSSRIAASAKAVNSLSNNLGGCKLITQGSGANTKYYVQMGADAASKKLLGSASGTLTIGYKYDVRVDYSTTTGGANYIPYDPKSVTGTITIVLKDGAITSYNNSGGSGVSGHVSIGNQWRGSTANFVITSVNFTST